ncbi:glycosyltransferase [Clostridium perfringens]|uniref:glycosyltransferase n=1 Tax=Clostridium perfringens TaxID=1502 RepID=UPI0039EBED83
MKSVCVIIINFNGSNDTIECLKSLEKTNYGNLTIAVIDNASKSKDYLELKEFMKNRYKENLCLIDNSKDTYNIDSKFILIKSDKNLGFSLGNNYVIRRIEEDKKRDFYMLLYNDTII